MKTVLVDWNLIPYAEAWQRQTEWFDTLVRAKAQGEPYENRIIMCEHPHVYTLGRSGKEKNMLLNDDQLKAIQATLFHIDRGGDITYHGFDYKPQLFLNSSGDIPTCRLKNLQKKEGFGKFNE